MFPKPFCLTLVLALVVVLPARAEIIKAVMGVRGAEMN